MKNWRRIIAAALSLLTVLSLAGCSIGGAGGDKPVLRVYNWGDYIDESVNDEFEELYGVKVQYETFQTNEDMYIKVKAGGNKYDVLIPSDYMIKKLINEDLLEKINYDNVPNYQYIDDKFKNVEFDPNNEYSVPYMWGTVGILYNKTMVDDPVDSWDILWNPKYEKQIFMLNSSRDSIGVALKKLGYSLNTKSQDEINEARDLLVEQKPLVLSYVGDEVKDKMIGEEAALAVVWSGDAVYCMSENENLAYAVPKEGSNWWIDSMVIPKSTTNKELAEKYINFLCEKETALKNTEYIGYSTPHTGAFEALDDEKKNDETAYPSEETLNNCEVFVDLSEVVKLYDTAWTEALAN